MNKNFYALCMCAIIGETLAMEVAWPCGCLAIYSDCGDASAQLVSLSSPNRLSTAEYDSLGNLSFVRRDAETWLNGYPELFSPNGIFLLLKNGGTRMLYDLDRKRIIAKDCGSYANGESVREGATFIFSPDSSALAIIKLSGSLIDNRYPEWVVELISTATGDHMIKPKSTLRPKEVFFDSTGILVVPETHK